MEKYITAEVMVEWNGDTWIAEVGIVESDMGSDFPSNHYDISVEKIYKIENADTGDVLESDFPGELEDKIYDKALQGEYDVEEQECPHDTLGEARGER